MKVESAILIRAVANMVREAIWMKGVIAGLLKIFVARNSEMIIRIKVSIRPRIISKVMAAVRMFLIF